MTTSKSDILSEQLSRLVNSGFGAKISSVLYNDVLINIAYPSDDDSFINVFADSDRYLHDVRKYMNCRTYSDVSEAVRYINAADKVTKMINDDPILGEGPIDELFDRVLVKLKEFKAGTVLWEV